MFACVVRLDVRSVLQSVTQGNANTLPCPKRSKL